MGVRVRFPARRVLIGFLLLALAGCDTAHSAAPAGTSQPAAFRGGVLSPSAPAPPLVLDDYTGKAVDLHQLLGKVVFVTFVRTHCPDVCPLIVASLHVAQAKLPPAQAQSVVVLAVSTDPAGDTPASIRQFLALHQAVGTIDYLVGSPADLNLIWTRWNVDVQPDPQDPASISHTAAIFGVSARGKITTIYPSNVLPSDIDHDVPLLASS